MLAMLLDSAKLFLSGKLFQDRNKVFRQLAMGAGSGALVLVVLAQFAPVWIATLAGGAVTGFLQPLLFKDLKFK